MNNGQPPLTVLTTGATGGAIVQSGNRGGEQLPTMSNGGDTSGEQ